MEPGPGVGGPGPGIMATAELMSPVGAHLASRLRQSRGNGRRWDVGSPGAFDSDAADRARPLQLSAGRHLSHQAHEHSRSAGRRAVSDARDRPAHAAHRSVPGAQRHSGAVHRGRLRPGALGQLRHQGDLSARSGIPGTGAGRRRDVGQHAARSGRRPDRRSRPSRRDHGDHPHRQQGLGSARRRSRDGRWLRRRRWSHADGDCRRSGGCGCGAGAAMLASRASPERCHPARPRPLSPA